MPKRRRKKNEEAVEEADDEDLPEPHELQVIIDGKPRRFTDYTREFTRVHYQNVSSEFVMVPPVVFHQNYLITSKEGIQLLRESSLEGSFKDVTVTDTSDSTTRGSVAEYRVAEGFRHFGQSLGRPGAVILGHKFENYLNKVKKKLQNVPQPADLKTERGEHDLLFICVDVGVLVVSVKSVGGNFAELHLSPEQQKKILTDKLEKAIKQLDGEVKVVRHVLSDLSPPVTCALAFPHISRQTLGSVLSACDDVRKNLDNLLKGDSSLLCLCSEEFPPIDQLMGRCSADDTWEKHLKAWYHRRFPSVDSSPPAMDQQVFEDVFGRYCGLFSTVEIHHRSGEGRIEVRAMEEAVAEVNRRFRSLILLPDQISLLCSSIPRVYLYGLMGSGKSVMLILKGRHWINSGCDVIVINVGYDSYGSPIGYRLVSDVKETAEGTGKVALLNVRLSCLDKAQLLEQVRRKRDEMRILSGPSASGPMGLPGVKVPVHFLLDEVYPKFHPVFEILLEGFPDSEIWASGLTGADTPQTFKSFEMTKVLRNPPSVQRILQLTDYESSRRERYTVCGAEEGLPSEGPDPRFILHQTHPPPSSSTSSSPFSCMTSYSPLNCRACAEETINIFSEFLVQSRKTSATCEGTFVKGTKRPLFTKGSASSVSLKDVVLLCKDPERLRVYPKQADGSYRLKKDLLREFLTMIDQSVYVDCLRQAGYPVRVVTNPYSEELAVSDQCALTASWVYPASGLEWAVVLFMPGDPAAESSGRSEPSESSQEPESSSCSEPLATAPSSGTAQVPEFLEAEDLPSKSSKNRSLSESPENPEDLGSSEGPAAGPVTPEHPQTSTPASEDLALPSETSETWRGGSSDTSERPGAKGGVGGGTREGLQAMQSRMSKRDREYLFWSASRCTAQLVVLVP